MAQYHLPPIPDGFQIFEERLDVAGIAHRKRAAQKFVSTSGRKWLELEPEPSNRCDPNAIKVLGCFKGMFGGKRLHVGYVPKEISGALANGGYVGDVRPRLLKTYMSQGGFVEIFFQLIGPRDLTYKYRDHARSGSHYTTIVDRVKRLKREERYEEAIGLLEELVEQTEEEAVAQGEGWGVAPWYYEQLGIIYRKQKRYVDEVAILERYANQPKAPGKGPEKLRKRLERARELLESHEE